MKGIADLDVSVSFAATFADSVEFEVGELFAVVGAKWGACFKDVEAAHDDGDLGLFWSAPGDVPAAGDGGLGVCAAECGFDAGEVAEHGGAEFGCWDPAVFVKDGVGEEVDGEDAAVVDGPVCAVPFAVESRLVLKACGQCCDPFAEGGGVGVGFGRFGDADFDVSESAGLSSADVGDGCELFAYVVGDFGGAAHAAEVLCWAVVLYFVEDEW